MFSRLILPITYNCNLDCDYCYVDKKTEKTMSLKMALSAIDFLIRSHTQDRAPISIIFTGGEPLLEWSKMLKMILYFKYVAARKKIPINEIGFPTNGLLLKKNILDFCRKENIKINISLDGAINKRKTLKRGNSFLLLEKKIPSLLKYKDIIRIKMTVHPDFSNRFENIFQKFVKIGFSKIDVQPALGVSWSEKQKKAYLGGLRKIFDFSTSGKNNVDVKNLKNFFNKKNKDKCCAKVREEFLVDLDGKIYPCNFFLGIDKKIRKRYSLGNIHNGVDMKLSKQYQNYKVCDVDKKIPTFKEKCSICKISQACHELCLGINVKTKKFDPNLAAQNWIFAREMEMIFKKIKK